jgi:hypothetical protein
MQDVQQGDAMTDVRSSEEHVEWFIILYEWQGARDLSNCREWWPSAEIIATHDGARSVITRYERHMQPANGRITYRNIRGPFPWSEPTS